MENLKRVDIAIIGAGVAGSSAMIELCKLGFGKQAILFERDSKVAMTSRHCNHQGFGLLEFKRLYRGLEYANRLEQELNRVNADLKLNHSLTEVEGDILTFSTPNGEIKYRAKKILFAMGARESTRASMELSGGRSPNIINTGALQRFTYIQGFRPFKKAVIIGSEIVAFSALMTAKEAGIEIVAMVEEQSEIKSFPILKPIVEFFKKIPIYTDAKKIYINTQNREVKSIELECKGKKEIIECDGVIISGGFIPESSILQQNFTNFNLQNRSLDISQNFQNQNSHIFLSGNVIRGALSAYKCYFEGKEVAQNIAKSISSNQEPKFIKIEADEKIEWLYPSLIEIDTTQKALCNIQFAQKVKGTLRVYLNSLEVLQKNIDAKPYEVIKVGWINMKVKESDIVKIVLD